MYHGIINVYKEQGYTSFDVVAKLRGIFGQKKIGHTGTLDPDAEGVLPVCLGKATKVCDMLTDRDKEYQAVMLLGMDTDTQDVSGTVLARGSLDGITEERISRGIQSFVGEISQIPPMYSALKVNGKKLYELARAGREVERKPRPVQISAITILKTELPEITFRVECSKGTYIRTLCHDIGQKLGCGGTMKSLKRTRVGRFRVEEARTLGELESLAKEDRLEEVLIPVEELFSDSPRLIVKPEFERLVRNGNELYPDQVILNQDGDGMENFRVCGTDGTFYGLYAFFSEGKTGKYRPVKMFLT